MVNDLLERKKEIEKKLEVFKDPLFSFDEASHVYKYKGEKFTSVTTFLKRFKVPFDKEFHSRKKAIELGVDQSVVLGMWDDKSKKSMDLGTKVHKYIEDFWSQRNPEIPDEESVRERVNKFLDIYERRFNKLVPLESELRIFSTKWKLAGTIDQPFLFFDEKSNRIMLIIGDWKSNEEFRDDAHHKGRYKKLLRPFNNLWENHHNEYSIQISIYRLILEQAGIETESGFLCHIGPGTPKIYPAKDLREILKIYLDDNT
jgi:hypothetical protein